MKYIKDGVGKDISKIHAFKDNILRSVSKVYTYIDNQLVLIWTISNDIISSVFGSGIWMNNESWNNEDLWKNE